uniref:Arf-GAP with coiled-coil, ANK repeat and PH domain-containing protein n=1 Tax=Globisporangium ultimum (strain ATCC 200006 / CBS 805.95 / DAOM BR144) TaxID=431595 RepID=K3X085_GLOUD
MDSRVAQLQHVIFLKDQMILELQMQLAAYEAHFGALDPAMLRTIQEEGALGASDSLGGVNTVASARAEEAAQAQRRRSSSSADDAGSLASAANGATATTTTSNSVAVAGSPLSCSSDDGGSENSTTDAGDLESAATPFSALSSSTRSSSIASVTTAASSTGTPVVTGTGKNVVLDFVEDSPMFRRQLEGFEESLGGLRGLLKEILARTKEYVASGMRYGEEETALAEEIVHRKYARALFTTSCPELGSLSSIFNEVHDTITQIQSSRVSMLLSIEALLHHSIYKFSEQELKEATDLRKEVGRLADEYESLLSKLLAKPKQSGSNNAITSGPSSMALTTSDPINILGGVPASTTNNATFVGNPAVSNFLNGPGSGSTTSVSTVLSNDSFISSSGGSSGTSRSSTPAVKSLEREVSQARLKFEMARFDLVRYLNRLDCQKKFLLIECFNSTLYAFLGHFHACHELVKSVEPALRERQSMLQTSKQDFEDDDKMWRAQREALEARLRMDFESETSQRSFELPIEVISRDTSNSRETYLGAIIKQGYLFLRNTMFPARSWKRRWFQIHSGKLYQNRGKHMDLVLVCDLMLSRVRESTTSNLPYCFEIIDSSQAKYLLQATSEVDMQDWIEAARKSTESMLEKQSHRMSVHPEQQHVIDELITKNGSCADCGQSPSEWVSINIGCFLCIECSGIHRSLGVHVSKVRSLTLDSWEMPLLLLLRDHLGNDVVNSIWEHTIPNGWTKLTAASTRDEKAKWIKAKYHFHGFAEFSDLHTNELNDRFIQGGTNSNLQELMWCLAHGVDVNARNAQRETALHASARQGAAACCDYLILNGASLVLADIHGKLPYDAAKAGGFEAVKLALMQKMSLEQYQF